MIAFLSICVFFSGSVGQIRSFLTEIVLSHQLLEIRVFVLLQADLWRAKA